MIVFLCFLTIFILLLIVGSLFMCGWYVVTRPGKIFQKWHYLITHQDEHGYLFPKWIHSPLSECIYCYASIYGSLIYWLTLEFTKCNLFEWANVPWLAKLFCWVLYCICSSAMNGLLIYKVLNLPKKQIENEKN
jgi:hypothetical protein